MHVILVEDDYFDIEQARQALERRFRSGIKITTFRNVGGVALAKEDDKSADIVVMEHFLPLLEVSEDVEMRFKQLSEQFPDLTTEWAHQEGGERLLKWMRANGMNMPVIFFTHSDIENIDENLFHDENVFYCLKSNSFQDLYKTINHALKAN